MDTMVFIYLYEDHPVYADVCESIVRQAADGRFTGVVTPIMAAELLVKPVQKRRFAVADRYRRAISSHPNIVMFPVDISTGFMAGSLQATYSWFGCWLGSGRGKRFMSDRMAVKRPLE